MSPSDSKATAKDSSRSRGPVFGMSPDDGETVGLSEPHTEAGEDRLRVGEGRRERVEEVSRLRGLIGVVVNVPLERAVDGGIVAEGGERLHALYVEAVPHVGHEQEGSPEGHGLAELVADVGGDLGRRLVRNVVREPGCCPLGQRLVEPGGARLVVPDEGVEPLVPRFVYDPLGTEVGADEDNRRVLLAELRSIGLDDDRVGVPGIGAVALRETRQRADRRVEERTRHDADRRDGGNPDDDGRRDVDNAAGDQEPTRLERKVAHCGRTPATPANARAACKDAHPPRRPDLYVEVGDRRRPRLELWRRGVERPVRSAPGEQREERTQPYPEGGSKPLGGPSILKRQSKAVI